MDLKEILEKCNFNPNDDQKKAIKHKEGPLLIIAGPGSGKTEVLIFRTLNLVLCHNIKPENILLCTFTEKAAEQLKARLKFYLSKFNREDIDLAKMSVGTIHSICNDIIQENLNKLPQLHKNYEVLEELTQTLFLYDNFEYIFGEPIEDKYLFKWRGVWNTIEHSTTYFNKVTEECIDVKKLRKDKNMFLRLLAEAYLRYTTKLEETNHIDFSFQQRHVLDLLENEIHARNKLREKYKYIMVDEYQDTNYVQEQMMLVLAQPENNICVVGDEDQALYRFRGATVRNILEFKDKFKKGECAQVRLEINYRSHKDIVALYNYFMDSDVWYEDNKLKFRFKKEIKHDETSSAAKLKYNSVVNILDGDKAPQKVAEIILFLKNKNIITDLNQIAFFMRSIAYDNTKPFLDEFERRKIPYYAPRAKKYLENSEIKELIACFIQILAYTGEDVRTKDPFKELTQYCDESYEILKVRCKNDKKYERLAKYLDETSKTIYRLMGSETLEIGLIDAFYKTLSFEPFSSYLEDDATARNLAIFSRLLVLFQQYYHLYIITAKNKDALRGRFFNSYLRFLILNGLNEYEDPYDIFPSGKVQVMTIHQAKGLEFPVVFVAGLEKRNPPRDNIDEILGPYYHRKEFEPYTRINDFDQMRLSYVAFSRPQNLVILVSQKKPFKYYRGIFEKTVDYNNVDKNEWLKIKIKVKDQKRKKLEYGFTSHINIYDICPKQYLMYKEYDFTPARGAQVVFGALVHQTIEDIHRHVIEKLSSELNESKILEYFEKNKRGFIKQGVHPFNEEAACEHVLNYFKNNKETIAKVQETEFEVVVEKPDYYLKGILDLIRGENGKLDILDFKAQTRPDDGDEDNPILESYRRQLSIYSHIVEKKKGIKPSRTIIYWTGEPEKTKAVMKVETGQKEVDNVIKHFDEVVTKIRNKEFKVLRKPDKKICKECDFRHCCRVED